VNEHYVSKTKNFALNDGKQYTKDSTCSTLSSCHKMTKSCHIATMGV